jgi:hypothetical protein
LAAQKEVGKSHGAVGNLWRLHEETTNVLIDLGTLINKDILRMVVENEDCT